MSKREIVHIELSAESPAATAEFYQELFDWDTQTYEDMGGYITFASGTVGGGFNPVGEQMNPGDVVFYIASDDIETDLKAIESKGGQTVVPKSEIPGMGWFAWFKDPTGNTVGLYTGMESG